MQPVTPSSNPFLGEPLGGTRGDWQYRILRFHIPLAILSTVVVLLWVNFPRFQSVSHQSSPQSPDHATGHQDSQHSEVETNHSGNQPSGLDGFQDRLFIARFTSATGYVALGLLGITLLVGPINLFLGRRTPISTYLVRDVGMWAAIMSVVHVIVGFFVHGPPAPFSQRILFYFFTPDGSPLTNDFGWGNWTGMVATVIVVGLLTISSDFALRKLKARNWKNLQRLNYILFLLVIMHAIFYGVLRRVNSIPTLLFGIIVILVLIGQLLGIWLWRRRHIRRDTLHQ